MSDRIPFRRKGGPKRIGAAVGRLLGRMDQKGGLRLVRLWRAWDELLGPEMAGIMRPLGHRGRTLLVSTGDPVVAQEASFLAPLVLERINEFFNEEVFDKVHFELLSGRIPLGEQRAERPTPPPARPKRPENLGNLARLLREDTPVARCYRAYLRLFAAQENDPTPSGAGGQNERRQDH
ncbi:DUF721 domain-containing protein [Desulfovibrio aminophilus]|nr:DUF721 domain-containing protein [Desulfovibrio aminophilus]MCM0754994.1 DUF721 domain-containing protein [Desulfovibrio aminophilus]